MTNTSPTTPTDQARRDRHTAIHVITESRGWTIDDLAAFALDFLLDTAGPDVQDAFIAELRQNATDDDPTT